MTKKLTYKFVKKFFESKNYILLSKEYKNSYTKLDYICPKGHRYSVTWHDFFAGRRCPICTGVFKVDIDFIRKEFKKENYILLTNKYINNKQKLDYICSKGHQHFIRWDVWQRGVRCPYCAGNKKLTIEFIRSEFKKEGYTLLTKTYINNKQKLEYICPNGHKNNVRWNDWQKGIRCFACAVIKKLGSRNHNWKGGKSFEPYCEVWKDQKFKFDIKERDGNRCLNPYCDSKDSNDLTIHHIDYNKKKLSSFKFNNSL